jgi:hypothetical protein
MTMPLTQDKINKKLIGILTVVLLLLICLFGGIFYSLLMNGVNSIDMHGYENRAKIRNSSCQALTPECGYCSGRAIDGFCYWD